MAPQAPVFDKADPKTEKLVPFHLPLSPEWSEYNDWYTNTAMMSAGAGMFLKNPLVVWGSSAMAVIGYVSQQPLRQKEASSALTSLGMGLAGILSITIPKVMLGPDTQTPIA
ncbi:hypothetical protein P7C73_g1641, partial [Tremellales sp. Uapishka_1]